MASRTKNALRNTYNAILFQGLNIVLKFVMRTVFIYCLGKEYLGVSGVFSNILTVLSLSELGLGSAIVYSMYRPIADNDKSKIRQYVKFFRKIYAIIGLIIFFVGCMLIPFLDKLVKDVPNVEHIRLIYILCLVHSSSSYFFATYSSLVQAFQMSYVKDKIRMLFSIIKATLECLFLFLTKSYIVYLLIEIALDIVSQFITYKKVVNLFPYILVKDEKELSVDERSLVWKDAMSSFSIKLGGTLINSTDNIIISAFISTIVVGLYSNYGIIVQIILTTTVLIQQSVMAGIGNLCTGGSGKQKGDLYNKLFFFYGFLYAFIFVGVVCAGSPFVRIWVGEDYLLSDSIVLIMAVNCYLSGMHQVTEAYIYSDGLFRYFRFKPWIEGVLNLIISMLLVQHIGLTGVLLGTLFSHLLTTFWYDAYVVYKYSLERSLCSFFCKYFQYILATVLSLIICKGMCILTLDGTSDIVNLILIVLSVFVSVVSVWSIMFFKSKEFKFYMSILRRRIKKS